MRNSPPQSSSNTLHTNTSTLDTAIVIVRGDVENISLLFYISFQAHLYSFPGEADTDTQLFSAVSVSFAPAADKSLARKTFIIQQLNFSSWWCDHCEWNCPLIHSPMFSEAGDKWKSERVGCTASPSSWAPAFSVVCYLACRGCLQLARRGRGRRVVTGDISGAAQRRLPGCSG